MSSSGGGSTPKRKLSRDIRHLLGPGSSRRATPPSRTSAQPEANAGRPINSPNFGFPSTERPNATAGVPTGTEPGSSAGKANALRRSSDGPAFAATALEPAALKENQSSHGSIRPRPASSASWALQPYEPGVTALADPKQQMLQEHDEVEAKVKKLLALAKAVHAPDAMPLGVLQRDRGEGMLIGDEDMMREVQAALDAWDAAAGADWNELQQSPALTTSQRKLLEHATSEVRLAKRAWAVFQQQQREEREDLAREMHALTRQLVRSRLQDASSAAPDSKQAHGGQEEVTALVDTEDVLRLAPSSRRRKSQSRTSLRGRPSSATDEETSYDPLADATKQPATGTGANAPVTRVAMGAALDEANTAGDSPGVQYQRAADTPPRLRRRRIVPVEPEPAPPPLPPPAPVTTAIEVQTELSEPSIKVDARIRPPMAAQAKPLMLVPVVDRTASSTPQLERSVAVTARITGSLSQPLQTHAVLRRDASLQPQTAADFPTASAIAQHVDTSGASQSPQPAQQRPASQPPQQQCSQPDVQEQQLHTAPAASMAPSHLPAEASRPHPPVQPLLRPALPLAAAPAAQPAPAPEASSRFLAAAAAAHLLRQQRAAAEMGVASSCNLDSHAAVLHAQRMLGSPQPLVGAHSSMLPQHLVHHSVPVRAGTSLSHSFHGSMAAAAGAGFRLPPRGALAPPPQYAWGGSPYVQAQPVSSAWGGYVYAR